MLQAILLFFKNLFSDQRPEYIPSARTEPIVMPQVPANEEDTPPTPEPQQLPAAETPITPTLEPSSQKNTEEAHTTQPQSENAPQLAGDTHDYMKLVLTRYSHGKKDTLGKLSIDGEEVCVTLEDKQNYDQERAEIVAKKNAGEAIPDKLAYTAEIDGDTRIPAGEYEIELRSSGGLHTTYEIRYPDIHKGMLYLKNVAGFSYIYIHQGNSNADTKGCILVGESIEKEEDTNAERRLVNSKDAYLKVYEMVSTALLNGKKAMITIRDEN